MWLVPRLVNRLKLKHWALLKALSETHTLNQAAEHINVTQPSATKMLSDMEDAFGFSLFERRARGLTPTVLGGEVMAYASRTHAGLSHFLEELEVKRQGGLGHLAIGACMDTMHSRVIRAVANTKQELPQLKVRIVGATVLQICGQLARHEIDVGVGYLNAAVDRNHFDVEALANERMCIVVRDAHVLAYRESLTWDEVARWPWVQAGPSCPMKGDAFEATGVSSPVGAIECDSFFSALQLVLGSDAIAMLPEPFAQEYLLSRRLHALPMSLTRETEVFGILTRKNETLPALTRVFVAHLRRHTGLLGELPP